MTPRTPDPIQLPTSGLTLDPEIQQRAGGLDPDTVDAYAAEIADWIASAPIIVYSDSRTRWVADGFHRIAAAELAGLYAVPAIMHEGTRRDALLHAVGANRAHGLRRTNADKRRAVETLLRDEEWSRWSDRRIAEQVGVSDKTVAAVRRELRNCGISAVGGESEKRVGADGKARTVPPRQPAPEQPDRTTAPQLWQPKPAPPQQTAPVVEQVPGDDLDGVRATNERLKTQTWPAEPPPAPKQPTSKEAMQAAHEVSGAFGLVRRALDKLDAIEDALLAEDAQTLIAELRKTLDRLTARFEPKEGAADA
ncbi:ParB/RepB/Spo0J family partition protein [Thiorhodococcus minor]|uniref:ParB N-terminal domain-containing protein n=1 Tax=Thiorhodococcus minor TaxID=57489 RepID=A0A6M0K4E5_9GAMM|nr:ParB/RepB/Spo0J family partition protein [Thiorhodococcus minor]NEV64141.1 ParB N-terminal domain-containing protein [Thiorhodococcus minor]